MNSALWRLKLWGVNMFIAIPKNITTVGWYECLLAQSKGQAKRILIQSDCLPEQYNIIELKDDTNAFYGLASTGLQNV